MANGLTENGLPLGPCYEGDWSPQSGYDITRLLIKNHFNDFTAIVVQNDLMAFGVLRALQEAGIRVPQDVSVIGYDDMPDSSFSIPPLTTLRQDYEGIGKAAIQSLMSVRKDHDRSPILLKCPLVIRESSGPVLSRKRRKPGIQSKKGEFVAEGADKKDSLQKQKTVREWMVKAGTTFAELTLDMPNWRFSESRVICWFCLREDEWVFRGVDRPAAEHYGYVRVSGILIPACEPCARAIAGFGRTKFDLAVWRGEAFLQQRRSCEYQITRRARREPMSAKPAIAS